jgi:uncharacterized membrane protein
MQSINITVINPWFMTVFLGTSVVCLVLIVSSLLRWQQPGTAFLLVSAMFYLIGCFGVTIMFNVPLNDALAVANPNSAEGANLWARYLTNWTFWNHVRAIAAFIAATLFTMALNASPKL